MDYLVFCILNNNKKVRGDSNSEIVTALIVDSIVNEHIDVRLGSDLDEKNYLWKVVKAYKAAKLEKIVETKSDLLNVADPSETEVTNENILEQLQELKAVNKGIKDATIRDPQCKNFPVAPDAYPDPVGSMSRTIWIFSI